jgi:hypothetical protein
MTPYELRFQIFQQANGLAQDEYHAKFAVAEQWNKENSVKMDYPEFPSYAEIEKLADKINSFVSSK